MVDRPFMKDDYVALKVEKTYYGDCNTVCPYYDVIKTYVFRTSKSTWCDLNKWSFCNRYTYKNKKC